jgi:hypothetical protein
MGQFRKRTFGVVSFSVAPSPSPPLFHLLLGPPLLRSCPHLRARQNAPNHDTYRLPWRIRFSIFHEALV